MANALQKPLTASAELSAVIGPRPAHPRRGDAQALELHQRHGCQNPENRREIVADTKLQAVFGGAAPPKRRCSRCPSTSVGTSRKKRSSLRLRCRTPLLRA